MTFSIIFLSIVVIAIIIYKSFNVLEANEIGIKSFLGTPDDFGIDSGFHWVWWPFEKINRYPKDQQSIKFTVKTIMTPKGKTEQYGVVDTAEINVKCGIFYYFDTRMLKKTIQNAPGNSNEVLAPELGSYTKSIVRALGGRLPWRITNEERFSVTRWVMARLVGGEYPEICNHEKTDVIFLKSEDKLKTGESLKEITVDKLEQSSPFVQWGLKNVTFFIEDINLTDEDLKKAISAAEKERLNKLATIEKADAEKYKKSREGEGDAFARKKMLEVINEFPDLEAMRAFESMAHGTSNTIWYQIPQVLDDKIKGVLGGNSFMEMFKVMKPEDQAKVKKYISDKIQKLQKP